MTDGSSGELLVGVKVLPDSTLDTSHALRMVEGTLRIKDPIVDRLRGDLVIDTEREAHYQALQAGMVHMNQEGTLTDWFIGLVNGSKAEGQNDISADDVTSLRVVTFSRELDQLRQQFGYRFARPYLEMNMSDFQNAYRALAGNLGAWGCVVNGGAFREDPLTAETGLIIASVLGPETIHEIIHTLDPYLNERHPKDAVLEEFAAYYRETYVPRIYTQKTTTRDGSGHASDPVVTRREVYENLSRIKATLKSGNYVPKYSPAFTNVAAYEKRVDNIATTLEKLERFMDKPAINKAILNAKSAYDLHHLLEVVTRERGY